MDDVHLLALRLNRFRTREDSHYGRPIYTFLIGVPMDGLNVLWGPQATHTLSLEMDREAKALASRIEDAIPWVEWARTVYRWPGSHMLLIKARRGHKLLLSDERVNPKIADIIPRMKYTLEDLAGIARDLQAVERHVASLRDDPGWWAERGFPHPGTPRKQSWRSRPRSGL